MVALMMRRSTSTARPADSADSTFRTVCFAPTSPAVRRWISWISPPGLATMRTDTTPRSDLSRASARSIVQPSGPPWAPEDGLASAPIRGFANGMKSATAAQESRHDRGYEDCSGGS